MIEQFTDEELKIIRNELKELDLKNQDKPKPHYLYRDEMGQLFSDRPESKKVAERVMEAISRITDFTLDCMRYGYVGYLRKNFSCSSVKQVPNDVSDEYYEMYGEIVRVIEKHIKPFERFQEDYEKELANFYKRGGE